MQDRFFAILYRTKEWKQAFKRNCFPINGLARYQETTSSKDLDVIDPMLLRLIEVSKALKDSSKRTMLFFSPEEKRLIRFYLNEWRNELIRKNNLGSADGVAEVILNFS